MDMQLFNSYKSEEVARGEKPTPAQKYDSFRRYHRRRKKQKSRRSVNQIWFGLGSSSDSDSEISILTSSLNDSISSAPQPIHSHRIKLNETFVIPNDRDHQFILPRICQESESDNANRRLDESSLRNSLVTSLKSISARTLNIVLREMRIVDRDRDRYLHAPQIKMILNKYNVQIMSILDQLLEDYLAPNIIGVFNYEDFMAFLLSTKGSISTGGRSAPSHQSRILGRFSSGNMSTSLPSNLNKKSVLSNLSNADFESSLNNNRHHSFLDREEARLLLELGEFIKESPKFDIDVFKRFLHERDHYGNGQISRQHLIRACEVSRLNFGQEPLNRNLTFLRWLQACDPIGKGNIFLIHKLVDYLIRSVPC